MPADTHATVELLINLLDAESSPPSPDDKILDLGCGKGEVVAAFLERGLDAVGCDIERYLPDHDESGRLRPFGFDPYRLPYDDETFDFLFSVTVFEHVMNPVETVRELHRIMKPGGVSVHIIPSYFRLPVEPHIFVPLANLLQNKAWLGLWALAGIRKPDQKNLSWREVMNANYEYCRTSLNYLPKKTLIELFERTGFSEVRVARDSYYQFSPGRAASTARKFAIPFGAHLVGTFREYALVAVR